MPLGPAPSALRSASAAHPSSGKAPAAIFPASSDRRATPPPALEASPRDAIAIVIVPAAAPAPRFCTRNPHASRHPEGSPGSRVSLLPSARRFPSSCLRSASAPPYALAAHVKPLTQTHGPPRGGACAVIETFRLLKSLVLVAQVGRPVSERTSAKQLWSLALTQYRIGSVELPQPRGGADAYPAIMALTLVNSTKNRSEAAYVWPSSVAKREVCSASCSCSSRARRVISGQL